MICDKCNDNQDTEQSFHFCLICKRAISMLVNYTICESCSEKYKVCKICYTIEDMAKNNEIYDF